MELQMEQSNGREETLTSKARTWSTTNVSREINKLLELN
jgi:hypothetical protein